MKDKSLVIKTIRKGLDLHQDKLANDLGVSVNTVSLIERGESEISEAKIKVIAKSLGIKFEELMLKLTESESINSKIDSDTWAQKTVDSMQARIDALERDKQFLQQLLTSLTEKVGKLRANQYLPHGERSYKIAA